VCGSCGEIESLSTRKFISWHHDEKWKDGDLSNKHYPDYCNVTIKCCRDCNEKLNTAEKLQFVRKKSYILKKLGYKGYGLFSAFFVKKGEKMLMKYGGEIISKKEADNNNYRTKSHQIHLTTTEVLDGAYGYQKDVDARWINSVFRTGKKKNVALTKYYNTQNQVEIWIDSVDDIYPGQELLTTYQSEQFIEGEKIDEQESDKVYFHKIGKKNQCPSQNVVGVIMTMESQQREGD